MSFCRICFYKQPSRDLFELQDVNQLNENGEKPSCEEIVLFCLGIKISDEKCTKLCEICYNKIIDFYNFKVLALKNEAHLTSIYPKKEELSDTQCSDDESHNVQEEEPYILISTEDNIYEYKSESVSDVELISTFENQLQATDMHVPETTGNAPKKKRGRPRKAIFEKVKSKPVAQSYVCDYCGKKVNNNIKQHMQLHIPLNERKTFKCHICGLSYASKKIVKEHINKLHFYTKQKCQICEKVVKDMRMHMLVVHNNHKLRFECVLCHHRFTSSRSLEYHMNAHTKNRPYQCDHCSGTYRTKVSLSMHIRQVHNKEIRLHCQFCSKGFFSKNGWQKHVRSHTKEKPYKCDQCGKCYARNISLRKHTLAHAEGQVNVCHKAFTDAEFFQKHMLSHTKEKKYPCRFCE